MQLTNSAWDSLLARKTQGKTRLSNWAEDLRNVKREENNGDETYPHLDRVTIRRCFHVNGSRFYKFKAMRTRS